MHFVLPIGVLPSMIDSALTCFVTGWRDTSTICTCSPLTTPIVHASMASSDFQETHKLSIERRYLPRSTIQNHVGKASAERERERRTKNETRSLIHSNTTIIFHLDCWTFLLGHAIEDRKGWSCYNTIHRPRKRAIRVWCCRQRDFSDGKPAKISTWGMKTISLLGTQMGFSFCLQRRR